MTKKVGVFVDTFNLLSKIDKRFGRRLNYSKYLERAVGDNILIKSFAYGLITNDNVGKFITCLRKFGFDPKYRHPLRKDNGDILLTGFNVDITLDVVNSIEKLDEVILGSTSLDLIPLINWVKSRGVRCVVMACKIPLAIREAADSIIEISEADLETQHERI